MTSKDREIEVLSTAIAEAIDRHHKKHPRLTIGTIIESMDVVTGKIRRAAPEVTDLPTTVKVGPYDFKIEAWNPHHAAEKNSYGQTTFSDLTIRLDVSHFPRHVADVMLHEIMHACYWVFDIQDEDKEERTVRMTATALVGVWRDNPGLFDWLDRNIRGA